MDIYENELNEPRTKKVNLNHKICSKLVQMKWRMHRRFLSQRLPLRLIAFEDLIVQSLPLETTPTLVRPLQQSLVLSKEQVKSQLPVLIVNQHIIEKHQTQQIELISDAQFTKAINQLVLLWFPVSMELDSKILSFYLHDKSAIQLEQAVPVQFDRQLNVKWIKFNALVQFQQKQKEIVFREYFQITKANHKVSFSKATQRAIEFLHSSPTAQTVWNSDFPYYYSDKQSHSIVMWKFQSVPPQYFLKPLNVHQILQHSPSARLARGTYRYFHYNHDGFNDIGWGCAYRSMQTLISWLYEQRHSKRRVPSIPQIQSILDRIDTSRRISGSKQWLGANQVSWVIGDYCEVQCQILSIESGSLIESIVPQLIVHLREVGCPVMYGGEMYAYTIVGIQFDQISMQSKFLILDPHYVGKDDQKAIRQKKGLSWKDSSIFKKEFFYNFCLPKP